MNQLINSPRRALIIRAGRLGDTVWGTTAIEPIRAYLGENTKIDIIIKKGMRSLFIHDPRIENIFEIGHRSMPILFSPAKLSVLVKSFQQQYDLAVDLEAGKHFSGLMRLISARQKICASNIPPLESRPEIHHAVCFIRYVLSQGLPDEICRDAAPSLMFPENIDITCLIGNVNRYLCLHPGNSLLARGKPALRSWPVEHWKKLSELIAQDLPEIKIVLIGEKNELELSKSIAVNCTNIINLAGKTSLQQLMTVLAKSQLLVTTDTGPAHVAAALSTPVISIFGPSDAKNTRPFSGAGGWAVAAIKNIGCNPCNDNDPANTCHANRCMQAVTPSDVLKLIQQALSNQPVTPIYDVGCGLVGLETSK